MRATLADVARHPSWLGSWWTEWPCRHKHFWMILLFDKGQGWLRWGTDERIAYTYIDEGLEQPEPYLVAPPLRRLWWWVRSVPNSLRVWLIGYEWEGRRERLTWEESHSSFSDAFFHWYRDDERRRELWGDASIRRRMWRRQRVR